MDRLEEVWEAVSTFASEHRVLVSCTAGAVCGTVLFLRFMKGGQCRSKANMYGKTVLITGANTGLGKETARDLARRGARVLIACRDLKRAEEAAADIRQSTGNSEVAIYRLDLSSLRSVRECAAEVISKESRLHVLINNAGIMWTPQEKTEDGYERQFAVNHLGHFLLTNLLLDLLRKSAPSRVVTVSSYGHHFVKEIDFEDVNSEKSYDPVMAYSWSKLANILFTKELSRRLQGSEVTANTLHPGFVATDLFRHNDKYTNPILKFFFRDMYNYFLRFIVKSSKDGAQTSIYLAVSEEVEGVSGKYFSDCAVSKESKLACDMDAAARLWTISEEMTGLKNK